MQIAVYHSQDIQAWEQRWFEKQNSSLGLMQQVAWSIAIRLDQYIKKSMTQSTIKIAVWCGCGNNAGDGYYLAQYLQEKGYHVTIFSQAIDVNTSSDSLVQAVFAAKNNHIHINQHFNVTDDFDCHIDALFGIGLNRELSLDWQAVIQRFNQQSGLKVALDVPSGIHANTGCTMPVATSVHLTYTILALKQGLLTGQAKAHTGQLEVVSLIPTDTELKASAFLTEVKKLPKRVASGHKGSYGHVLVVGGHAEMGGAVIMAAEAAFSSGAGKVTVICDARHHTAILARSPNIMTKDIQTIEHDQIHSLLDTADTVCFGMGLGRDQGSAQIFKSWFDGLMQNQHIDLVLDADALWFLAEHHQNDHQNTILHDNIYCTPHPGEAAKLLGCKTQDIEQDRFDAIYKLQQRYGGQWVLKGSGSLILENNKISICSTGNAGMATGGMGDVLSGMIAGLKAQFHDQISVADIVTLHGHAGDQLALQGQRGLQAANMAQMIVSVVN